MTLPFKTHVEAEPLSELRQGAARIEKRSMALRVAPPLVILAALALSYAFGLHEYLSLEALRRYRESLAGYVEANPVTTAVVYVVLYILAVAVSFPGASIFTAAGGLMFGYLVGSALAIFAATVGAIAIFLIARTSVGAALSDRAGPRLQRLREGFQENSFSYLLFLRLLPIFPFWIVNLAAAFFGVRLIPYAAATAIGILPGTFVYSYFGAGIGSALEDGGSTLSPQLFIGLVLLAAMALLPIAYRKWRAGRHSGQRASS